MIDDALAKSLGQKIIDAWNSHDLARILALYAEDIVVVNPMFFLLLGLPEGTLRGKDALRPHWKMVLEQLSHLKFKFIDSYAGMDSFALNFTSLFEKRTIEVFTLGHDNLITQSVTYYDSLSLPR